MVSFRRRGPDGKLLVRWADEFEAGLPSLAGKRIAITGTTTGTGFHAALVCAKKGAEVILLNRDSERATSAEQKLRAACPTGLFVPMSCDLQSFESVRAVRPAFDRKFGTTFSPASLDVLVCNAGIMMFPDKVTEQGFDVQMQTNHFSHFLLVKELMPALKIAARDCGEARIVAHSSLARQGTLLDEKFFKRHPSGALGGNSLSACLERYHQTKLANIAFTYALEARLAAAGLPIKALVAAPGGCETELGNSMASAGSGNCCWTAILTLVNSTIQQSAADGTMPLLQCIAGKDVVSGDMWTPSRYNEINGPVVVSRKPKLSKRDAKCADPANLALIWPVSEEAIGERFEV
mmetsp:Transcript_33704/g.93080  ORF Transcript_33704/g.93080 Transcript_33704/m.93080 type:complete len:350 (-) Transcript_33704:177-1226(-)